MNDEIDHDSAARAALRQQIDRRLDGRVSLLDLVEVHEVHLDEQSPTNPAHYDFAIEPIDAIESWGLGFCLGNVVKYVARADRKNGLEDLEKAAWYLSREIERRKKEKR